MAVLAAAATAFVLLRDRGPSLPRPDSVELPARPANPGATGVFLRRSGRPLVGLHQAAAALLARDLGRMEPRACRAFVRGRLVKVGQPRALQALTARVPDRAARDMFAAELASMIAAVRVCGGRAGAADAERSLRFHHVVLGRRLAQLRG